MFIITYCHNKLATRCHWYNFYVYVNRVKHDSFHFTMFILHWFCLLSKAFESFTNNWKSWYSKRIVKWMYRNLNQSWILLKDKKQQADMLCKQQFQINHPFHMVLTFPKSSYTDGNQIVDPTVDHQCLIPGLNTCKSHFFPIHCFHCCYVVLSTGILRRRKHWGKRNSCFC